jgi:hypothetical protein
VSELAGGYRRERIAGLRRVQSSEPSELYGRERAAAALRRVREVSE